MLADALRLALDVRVALALRDRVALPVAVRALDTLRDALELGARDDVLLAVLLKEVEDDTVLLADPTTLANRDCVRDLLVEALAVRERVTLAEMVDDALPLAL